MNNQIVILDIEASCKVKATNLFKMKELVLSSFAAFLKSDNFDGKRQYLKKLEGLDQLSRCIQKDEPIPLSDDTIVDEECGKSWKELKSSYE